MGKNNCRGDRNFIHCVNDAINGIVRAFLSERNLRIHFIIGVFVLIASLVFDISRLEMIAVIFSISLVIAFEMINTAIEKSVDLFTEEYNELAKFVKDVSAGAVLVTSINAAGVGCLVFFEHIVGIPYTIVNKVSDSDQKIFFIAITAVIIFVFGIKIMIGKGSYTKGGFPSGHSAVSFSIATVITFSNEKLLVSFLAYALAVIVSESRVASKIHTRIETIAGAALGMSLTVLIFNLLKM